MKAPRPGSRKAQVFDAFMASGAPAAVELGASLGLADGTTRSWLGAWAKGGDVEITKPKIPKRIKFTESAPTGHDWGSGWNVKRAIRAWWNDNMGWAMAPVHAVAGDGFTWAGESYRVSSIRDDGTLVVRKLRAKVEEKAA